MLFVLVGCQSPGPDFSTPESTVRAQLRAIKDSRPEIVWDSMPARYRQDVTNLVHETAQKVDPESWEISAGLFVKLSDVAVNQRDFIVGSSLMSVTPVGDELAKNWDQLAASLHGIAHSELTDLDALKTVDIRAFLAGQTETLRYLSSMEGPSENDPWSFAQRVDDVSIKTLESTAQQARLELSLPPAPRESAADANAEPLSHTVELVRVEDRWVSRELAEGWQEMISSAREKIAVLDSNQMQLTAQQREVAQVIDGVLDQLAAATTQEEFDTALQSAVGMVMGVMLGSNLAA